MPRLLKTELPHQRKAFERYYALEDKRSYAKVATEIGVDVSTVKLWGRSFTWTHRVRERDMKTARQIADRALQDGQAGTERNLKIVRVALMRLAKGIASGQLKMQLGDLDRLIRLEQFLEHGPPTRGGEGGTGPQIQVIAYMPENGRTVLLDKPKT